MKWIHEFYQRNPDDSNGFYYFSQRRAWAILESVKEIKKGYYKAKVVSIESDDEFKVMSQGGGCTHQYCIGEVFYLRQHKNKNNHDWFTDFSSRFWYDPKIPGRPYGERFKLIEEKKLRLIMSKNKVLVSVDELNRLKACEATLYAYQDVKGLCPICERAMLLEGLICPHCSYDNSSSVEEWKQMHENKN